MATIGFSLVDGVLLRPLPYATPDRLVTIWERASERNRERNPTSPANFYAWSDGLKQVEGLTALTACLIGVGPAVEVPWPVGSPSAEPWVICARAERVGASWASRWPCPWSS